MAPGAVYTPADVTVPPPDSVTCQLHVVLGAPATAQVNDCVERVRQEKRWIPIEASGGIVLENIRAYAETGVDFISVGALTHSAKAADISMTIVAEPS